MPRDTLTAAGQKTGAYTVPLPHRDHLGRSRLHWRRWQIPDVLTVLAGLAIWRIFFPALMSQDSMTQYHQALTGQYADWHPPLMAITLHFVLVGGAGLGLLMLVQCLAGVFGVRALASEVIRSLWPERHGDRAVAWRSLMVLGALLLPVTPLAFYLMTFWKDAWTAVVMLWLGATILELHRRGRSPALLGRALILSVALGMLRHNAVVVLPVIGLALAQSVPSRRTIVTVGLALAPVVGWLAADRVLAAAAKVHKTHPDSQVMVLDLVGLCSRGPEICHQLAWTESHIRDPAAVAAYRPGNMGLVYWQPMPTVDLSMRTDYPRLRAEYLRAIHLFPLELAWLKVQGLVALLGLDHTYYFFHPSIIDNPEGLVLNTRFARLRAWLVRFTGNVGANSTLRWVSGVHAVWLTANLAWILALSVLGWRRRRPELTSLGLCLAIPLGYYASYLLAAPVEDFRFMYPSTLFVQCVTLAAVAGGVQKPTGRAPYLRRLSAYAGAGA